MRRFTRNNLWRPLRRRLAAGLTLVAYLVAVFGLPMPAQSRHGETKACGCAPQECHDGKCCCAPKPAPPPPPKPPGLCCEGKPGCPMPCCQHGETGGGCKHETPPAPPPRAPSDEPEQPADDDDDASEEVTIVRGIAGRKCRGHSPLWTSPGPSLPVPSAASWQPTFVLEGWLRRSSDQAISVSLLPPDPPPRSVTL